MKLLENPKFKAVIDHFANACRASREHGALASQSLEQYGNQGSTISGVVRDHFPADLKNRLRELARTVTRESDLAYAARPYRVRLATIRKLGSLVAQRDGSGFYGPRG